MSSDAHRKIDEWSRSGTTLPRILKNLNGTCRIANDRNVAIGLLSPIADAQRIATMPKTEHESIGLGDGAHTLIVMLVGGFIGCSILLARRLIEMVAGSEPYWVGNASEGYIDKAEQPRTHAFYVSVTALALAVSVGWLVFSSWHLALGTCQTVTKFGRSPSCAICDRAEETGSTCRFGVIPPSERIRRA